MNLPTPHAIRKLVLKDRLNNVTYRLFYDGEKDKALDLMVKWDRWWLITQHQTKRKAS